VRHAVQQAREVAAEVGVPGVRVHQVGAGAVVGDGQVDAKSADRGVRVRESGQVGVRRGALFVARRTEGMHLRGEVVTCAERPDQLGHVYSGAAVDLGRVLLAQDVDTHVLEPTPGRPTCRGLFSAVKVGAAEFSAEPRRS
jgi:hypothetical protein